MGVLTLKDDLGPVETVVLVVQDADENLIARSVLGVEILDPGKKDYEFNLRSDLLANSVVLISRRDKDDLHVYKVKLGTFPIKKKK